MPSKKQGEEPENNHKECSGWDIRIRE